MSNRRKNNHYHYAEKFENKDRSSSRGKIAYMPFKSVIISLAVLLMFGFVSTTFAAYVSDNEPDEASELSPIISEVRNLKDSRDIAYTGADVDLAETGGEGWMTMNGGGYFIFDNSNSGWSDVQMLVGRRYNYGSANVFCRKYNMTNISGTNLYALQISNWATSEPDTKIYDIVFITGASSWNADETSGDGANPVQRRTYATNYSAVYSNDGGSFTSTGVYACSLASGSNNAAVTISTITTTGYSYYNYYQYIQSYTSTDGSSYSSSNDGGLISFSGVKLNSNSGTTASTDETGKFKAAITSSVTLTATPSSGYRFAGWYEYDGSSATQITSSTTGYVLGTDSSNNPTVTYTVTGERTIYAYFMRQYTVTITKSPSGYSGTAPSIGNGSDTSLTVDVGTSVALNNNLAANSDISCTFRSGSATGTVVSSPQTINANTDFYACYSLAAPSISAFSYANTIVADGTDSISPTKTVSAVPSDGTQSSDGTQTITYSIAPNTGTTASSGTYGVASDGTVTATTPGQYTVTITVTNSLRGLTSGSTTATATVTVKPIAVSAGAIMWTATNHTSGSGTYAAPFKTPVNRTMFTISSYIPDAALNSNYTYNWTRTDGTYLISNGTITPGSRTVTSNNVTSVSDTASSGSAATDVIHNSVLADTQGYIYKIAVTTNQNGVSSDPTYVTIYYGVTADFLNVLSFDFSSFNNTQYEEVQKVYAEDSGIDHIDASYDAGGTKFNTMLWFSNNNIDYSKVAVWTDQGSFTINSSSTFSAVIGTHSALPNDSSHLVHDLITQISTVARNNVNLMATTGPKWFRGYIDDYQNAKVEAQTPEIHNSSNTINHTTVGTASTVSNRPIYYVDHAHGTDVTVNSRVMAFFLEESDDTYVVHYQTAQTVANRTDTYRFYIPNDATHITFAHVANNNYVIPTAATNTVSGVTVFTGFEYTGYASTVLKAWTPTIDLNAAANVGMTAFVADTAGTPTDGIYNYTNTGNSGNMTTLG